MKGQHDFILQDGVVVTGVWTYVSDIHYYWARLDVVPRAAHDLWFLIMIIDMPLYSSGAV